MVVSVDVLPMVLGLALAMPRLLRIALQPRRERRALDLYERCRIPGSDAAAEHQHDRAELRARTTRGLARRLRAGGAEPFGG